MAAGTPYAKRYPGGFVDKPTLTTPIDQQFLNAVEAALLQLIGVAPNADAQVMQWDNANTRFGPALLLNKNIDPAAAIAKSKLDFTGANGIVNADVAGAAAIARSKLDFGAGLVNADISTAAAIARSKLAIGGTSAQYVKGDGTLGTTPIQQSAMWTYTGKNNGALTAITLSATAWDDTSGFSNWTSGAFTTVPAAGKYIVSVYHQLTGQSGTGGGQFEIRRQNSSGVDQETLFHWDAPFINAGATSIGIASFSVNDRIAAFEQNSASGTAGTQQGRVYALRIT